MIDTMFSRNGRNVLSSIGIDMLTDFVSGFLARRALSKREQKQNNVLLFWDKAQRAKKVVNISLPIDRLIQFHRLICRCSQLVVLQNKMCKNTFFINIF